MGEFLDLWFPSCHSPKLPSASSNSPLIIFCRLPTPHHSECQEKKNVQLTPSMNLSSITSPDYGKEWPNFWFLEIQFNQSQAWTWSHLGASQCLWSNSLLSFPEPEARTHLPIIRNCHGDQIHCWCQPDIFFLLAFSMTRHDSLRLKWFFF